MSAMQKPQYAILRFAKYKGPEIGQIEAHNERKKEKYASNPDVDVSRSHLNYHLVQPERKYRAEAEKQIAEAGCRTRKDSVRVVEALVTASPEFFKGKKRAKIRTFFEEAVRFITKHQNKSTIISAVVHMDEKTPHMHLSFVPLTPDKRLSAKDIVGNKKKLTWWQDAFWKHMVKKWNAGLGFTYPCPIKVECEPDFCLFCVSFYGCYTLCHDTPHFSKRTRIEFACAVSCSASANFMISSQTGSNASRE